MPSRMLWAQLLARIYEVLPLLCPVCGGEMRIISFITLPSTVQRILLHLDLPHRPPRVSPARGPPQAELHLDQTPPSISPSQTLSRNSSSISRRPRTGSSEARSRLLPARPVLAPGRPSPPIRTSLGPHFPWRSPRQVTSVFSPQLRAVPLPLPFASTFPARRLLAWPDPSSNLASHPERPFEWPSMGQAVKTHLSYTLSDLVLTASVRFLRRPGRSLAE